MSNLLLTPTQIISAETLSVGNPELKKAFKKFDSNPSAFLLAGSLKLGKSTFRTNFNGTITTNGINCMEFDKKQHYSLGFSFLNESDTEDFEKFEAPLYAYLLSLCLDDWTVTTPLKDDKIYFKLKYKKRALNAKTNIKVDLKKLDDLDVERNQKVQVIATASYYFNLKDRKAGISMDVQRINFTLDSGNEEADEEEEDESSDVIELPKSKKQKK